MSLLALYTTKAPCSSLETFLSLPGKNGKNRVTHSKQHLLSSVSPQCCVAKGLSAPTKMLNNFTACQSPYLPSGCILAIHLPCPMSWWSRGNTNSLPNMDSNGYFSCMGGEEKEKERNSGPLPAPCPQGSTRVGTWPLSCVFAARLCLWCKVMGTHAEDNAQKYKNAESEKG